MSSTSRNTKPARHKQALIKSMFKVRPTPSISPTKQAAPTREVMTLDEDCNAEKQGSKPLNVEYVSLPDETNPEDQTATVAAAIAADALQKDDTYKRWPKHLRQEAVKHAIKLR